MLTLETVDPEILFALFKGEPGTRKSTQALSFPLPQYWISRDKKMKALHLPAKRWGIDMKQVHYDDYDDHNGPKAMLEKLQISCPYKTIIVDSITSYGDGITSQVKKAKSKDDGGGKKIGGIAVDGLEEFNAESAAFRELIALLQDIHHFHKVNIILIAHVVGQRKSDDKNNLTHHSRVIITGGDKIAGKIASYVQEAYHFNVESDFNIDSGTGKYGLFTSHTGNDYARTSLPLPRRIEFNDEPLYDKWIKPAILSLKNEKPVQRLGPVNPSFQV